MKRWCLILVPVVLACAFPLQARNPEPAQESATAAQAEAGSAGVDVAKVATLVADLGATKWEVRESAEAQLEAMPAAVLDVLDRHLAATSDAEILDRLERVYRRHVPREQYIGKSQQPGFLGVEMSVVSSDEDPRLYPRQYGVKIQRVVGDSAAMAVGLQADDLIVTVDGEELVGDVRNNHFIDRIQRVGEGGKVALGFFRGDELKRVTATLTARIREVVIPNRPMPRPAEPEVEDPAAPDLRVVDYRWTKYWKARQEKVRARHEKAEPEASAAEPEKESVPAEPAPSARGPEPMEIQ